MTHRAYFSDPVAAFQAAVDALNAEDWATLARLCDPVSVRSFRRDLIAQFAPTVPVPEMTVEDMLRLSPDMPREAAEYQVALFRRHSDPARRLHDELPGVASVDALVALSPIEAFAAWLDGRSFRRQVERMAERGHMSAEAARRHLADAPIGPLHPYVAIGAVPDGERIAHVLYRMRMDETEPWQGELAARVAALPDDEQTLARDMAYRGFPRPAMCRRQPDGAWALVANDNFLGVGSMFIGEISPDPAEPAPEVGGEDC